ncbi:methyl-CpG-binding domain-containing protein 13 [Forsythia ovata]|uniref:Methyl-CpG-binding domain-containing protein 13 n=1 Tax=Forsythia ovata TaxID=205694 RepID=A0ABD1WNU5_9LAMI
MDTATEPKLKPPPPVPPLQLSGFDKFLEPIEAHLSLLPKKVSSGNSSDRVLILFNPKNDATIAEVHITSCRHIKSAANEENEQRIRERFFSTFLRYFNTIPHYAELKENKGKKLNFGEFDEMSDHPDWLPAGWKIKIGVRESGKRDKYYIDPSNKHKFNSKPEVLRYLKNAGPGIKRAKSKKLKNVDASKHSAVKIDIKKTVAENLPPGWIKEIRIKKNGRRTRSDPSYIDPVSGRHFRSMQEVFRYLEARDSGKVESKPKDRGPICAASGDPSQSSSSGAKRKRLADNKEDKHVTGDQSSKPVFKGTIMNNANIMLEAKQLKPREAEDVSVAGDIGNKLQLVNGKEQLEDRKRRNKKLAGNEVEKNVNGDQTLESGSKGASTKNVNPPEANHHQQSVKDDAVAGDVPDKLSLVNKVEQHEDTVKQYMKSADSEVDKNANGDPSLTSGLESAEMNNDNTLETNNLEQRVKQNESVTGDLPDMQLQVNRMEQHENRTNPKKQKRMNGKTLCDLPRRTSERLAKIEVRSVEVKTRNEARPVSSLSGETEVNGTNKFCNRGSSNGIEKFKTENSDDNKQKGSAILPLRDLSPPKMRAGDDCKGGEKQEMPIDMSFNDLLKDPCIEFAIKTLTGAIPIEDVNKVNDSSVSTLPSSSTISVSSSDLPLGDVWADPCFEFAVKTLTGEIPTVDNSHVQNSSPLDSSEISRDNGLMLPNFRTALHEATSYRSTSFSS